MLQNKIKNIKLNHLGYSNFFENNRRSAANKDLIPARIIAEHKESYILRTELSEFSAKITGKMMFTASSGEDYPAVGDWVLISILDKGHAVINEILPRKTILKRKSTKKFDIQILAANIDTAFIIQSVDRDYNLNRFERYLSIITEGRIIPVIVLNKIDLVSESELSQKTIEIKERFNNIETFFTSTVTGIGITELMNFIMKGQTYCFIGSSGVGKSSIINRFLGKEIIRTDVISSYTNRGKHTTTHRELFILDNGGLLIDNPGLREIGMIDSDTGIKNVFSEISAFSKNCRFSDCTHMHEPGCAILAAVESGELDENKYNNYIKLVKENEYSNMNKLEKRQKNRKFGKFIKQFKKDKKKYS